MGDIKILRALPRRQRRMVGPWCFLDRFGPLHFAAEKPMDVAPHPHIGLQTVSWLLEGEIIHHDSLGCEALARPGQLNLMTAGHGIAHSEETPKVNSGLLSGVQLWVALPDLHRDMTPAFDHYPSLPTLDLGDATITLIAGSMFQHTAPARTFSPIIGAEIVLHSNQSLVLPLRSDFEHALFILQGDFALEGHALAGSALHYLGSNRDELSIAGSANSRLLLIGGEPFKENIMMWWNFVARTREEMAQARQHWINHERFAEVKGYRGVRLPAPEL